MARPCKLNIKNPNQSHLDVTYIIKVPKITFPFTTMTFNVFTQHLVSVDLDRKSSGCILLIAIREPSWSTTWDAFSAKCRFTASLAISPIWGITSRWVQICLFCFRLFLSKFLIIFPLQVEHEMVRYEVELMLHLCFISKEEHDTIIKILTFRFANMHVSWLIFVTTCM